MTLEPSIRIKNLSKAFQGRDVIESFNLTLEAGSFTSVVGPSGCGKSTLLRLIAGLDKATKGEVSLPASLKSSVSFVFQDANLLAWRTAFENAHLPLELHPQLKDLSESEKTQRVQDALAKVQLRGFEHLFPHELSGGMKMRVSIARALVASPKLLLLDEPFAALDEVTRFEMQNQLLSLWKKEQLTIVFVTHSLFEAAYISERIIMLKGPGAKIASDKKVDLPKERTEDLRTSEALNKIVRELSAGMKL